MKIAILIDELISGGFQKVAIMETKYFRKMGYNATLVVLRRNKKPGYHDLLNENKIRTIYLSDRLPWYYKFNFKFPLFSFFSFFHVFYYFIIYKFIKNQEFDVFITHGTYTAFSSISIWRKKHIPYICFIHDSIIYILNQKYGTKVLGKFLPFLTPIANKLDGEIINNSKTILAFPNMISEMKKNFPRYEKYHPVYNGCEVIDLSQVKYNKENYAIAVTKWDEGKNFQFLIDIWTQLNNKIKIKIIGAFYPVELREEYQTLIFKNRLEKWIELIGPVNEEDLGKYYQNALFLVHPCREAFGMTILEAAASGCPSIFTINSGVADLFPQSIKTKLPQENNINDYMFSINYILNLKTTEYNDLMNVYYNVALQNSWENHCKDIIKLFETI